MTRDSKQKISKIHTYADDVADIQGTQSSPDTETSAKTTSVPAEHTSRPNVKSKSADHTPRSSPVPTTEMRRADEYLQQKDSPTTTIDPSMEPLPHVAKASATPQPSHTAQTIPPEPHSKTTIQENLETDLAKQVAGNPDAATAIPDADSNFETGSIVTDKKQRKFRFFSALGASILNTAQSVISALVPKPTSSQSISSADTRRDTITSAAKRSYNVPENDFSDIKKIKTSQATEAPESEVEQNLQIKDAAAVAPSDWSHYTVDEPAATPESVEADAAPVVTQTDAWDEQPAATLDVPDTESPTVSSPTSADTVERDVIEATEAPESEVDTSATGQVTNVPSTSWNYPATATEAATSNADETEDTQPKRTFPTRFVDPTPPPRFAWLSYVSRFAIVFVILGAIGLGASTAVFWFGNFDSDSSNRVLSVPSLLSTNQQRAIPLDSDRDTLLSTLSESTERVTQLTQLYPVYDITSDPVVPANTSDIFNTLAFRIPGNLQRNIISATFGSTADNQPFLIMRVQDFDTTFAGLLTWEAAMSADLAPWFGEPVIETFDPNARTASQLRQAFFVDTMQDNANLRVLVDANQAERITYGFITPQLVLITTTPTVFRNLKSRIQDQ